MSKTFPTPSPSGQRSAMRVAAAALAAAAGLAVVAGLWLRSPVEPPPPGPPPGPPPAHGASKHANVVILLLDTLRADRLGSYGFDADTSPELDRLAAQGVRFARPIAQTTWTRPSIGSMLTSRYPRSIGIYEESGQTLADRYETFAEVLKQHGYTSLAATANPNTNTAYNFHQGYDQYIDSTVRFDWMRKDDGAKAWAQAPLQSARDLFTELLGRVRKLDAPPYHLMATVMEMHEADDPRVDLSAQDGLFEGRAHARYLRAIRKTSADIDWFMKELAKLPGWERTLLVVVSDHGEGLDSHPGIPAGRWHGWLTYESLAVVPLFLYSTADDLPRGAVVSRPVRLLDVMPTLLDLLGIEGPAGMQGQSLRTLMGSGEPPPPLPDHFVVETQMQGKHSIGVYADDWKYIEHRRAIPGTDAREMQPRGDGEDGSGTNRIADQRKLADQLRTKLNAWDKRYPPVAPTLRSAPISKEMQEQLRSLGYLGDEP